MGSVRPSTPRFIGRQRPLLTFSIISTTPTCTIWPMKLDLKPRPPISTGGGRWRQSISWTWSRPRWVGRRRDGSATSSRLNTATSFWFYTTGSTRIASLVRHGVPARKGPRSIAGRVIGEEVRVVTFVSRSLDRLRGFDRFLTIANELLRARADVVCVVVGDPIVRRGLDVEFHNRDFCAYLAAKQPPFDPDRLWFLGLSSPALVAEVLAAADLHIAPSRSYPVARSLLEAMAAGCVVLASDTDPHREIIEPGRSGLLANGHDTDGLTRQALAVIADRAAYRPLGEAAAQLVREHYSQDACMPRLAERFTSLAVATGGRS